MSSTHSVLGSIVSLWRYPVKSMMGEELNAAEVTKGGLLGDRAYALIDTSDGKVASAKNPRKWPQLFDFRAALTDAPATGVKLPPVRITLPDGTIVNSDQPGLHKVLSKVLQREVTLDAVVYVPQETGESTLPDPRAAAAEEYWADIEGLEHRDTVTDFGLPEGTFFDCAVVHLLTTATLDRLRELFPPGRFEVRRFRPNIVVETANGEGLRGECLDRASPRDRRFRSPQRHRSLSALRDDHASPRRSPAGSMYPAHSRPVQPGQRWDLCLRVAGRQGPPR